jgi:hypothetical protein
MGSVAIYRWQAGLVPAARVGLVAIPQTSGMFMRG